MSIKTLSINFTTVELYIKNMVCNRCMAADYVPSWIPFHLPWLYFTGAALLGSGVAIILKIKRGLIAALLGTMIFIWFIILPMPRVIASPAVDMGDEITSAMLVLAYSGIAFVIAGSNKARQKSLVQNGNRV